MNWFQIKIFQKIYNRIIFLWIRTLRFSASRVLLLLCAPLEQTDWFLDRHSICKCKERNHEDLSPDNQLLFVCTCNVQLHHCSWHYTTNHMRIPSDWIMFHYCIGKMPLAHPHVHHDIRDMPERWTKIIRISGYWMCGLPFMWI